MAEAFDPARVEALAAGTGFVDLSAWRKVSVSGGDALAWLNDLVSADLAGLVAGRAIRALLLSPTGGIRAEFSVALADDDVLLLQDPVQPRAIDALLATYVLSSDVELEDRTDDLGLFAFPGRTSVPEARRGIPLSPSCVGAGVDLLCPAEEHRHVLEELLDMFVQAEARDLGAWRTGAGIPRFGVDATEQDLPQEAGLEEAVSFGKGCYLGQEAMAKVRNLGHPRRAIRHLHADGPVSAGDPVRADDGVEVGRITSVGGTDGRWMLAVVAWTARDRELRTAGGTALRSRAEAGNRAGRLPE
jgi:folate-binding protein YgfZ